MAETETLFDIFSRHGTDKVFYARAYAFFLGERRHDIRKLLEIGIGSMTEGAAYGMVGYAAAHYRPGGSLRAWRDYCPSARILGLDVQPDTQFTDDRIDTALCNSTDAEAVARVLSERDFRDIDLIIDDGSHAALDQLATLDNTWPFLKPGGLYVIEDVGGNGIMKHRDRFSAAIGHSLILGASLFNSRVFPTKYDHNPIFIVKEG